MLIFLISRRRLQTQVAVGGVIEDLLLSPCGGFLIWVVGDAGMDLSLLFDLEKVREMSLRIG